jgi:uncharacterized protein (TIGR00369 family)
MQGPGTGLDSLLGLEFSLFTEDEVRASAPIVPHLLQPFGIVHGGTYAAIAETVASMATAAVVIPGGELAMGMSNNTSFLRAVRAGTIHVHARCRHRGRTTWVWDVDMSDDGGRLTASSRVTMAVRPFREGEGPPQPAEPQPR